MGFFDLFKKKQVRPFHISFSYGFVLEYELLCRAEMFKMEIVNLFLRRLIKWEGQQEVANEF